MLPVRLCVDLYDGPHLIWRRGHLGSHLHSHLTTVFVLRVFRFPPTCPASACARARARGRLCVHLIGPSCLLHPLVLLRHPFPFHFFPSNGFN